MSADESTFMPYVFQEYPKCIHLDSEGKTWKTAHNAEEERQIRAGMISGGQEKVSEPIVPVTTSWKEGETVSAPVDVSQKRGPGRPKR
jgi:hypothetical protein